MDSIFFRGREIKFEHHRSFFANVAAGKWEPETFDVLDKHIEPGKVFIDCGAWMGVLSIYAALLGAEVYSLEPDEVAFSKLVDNIHANQLEIIAEKIAISDHCGTAELNSMSEFGNSESSLIERGMVAGSQIVETETLGYFIEQREIYDICLIKIDIEGGEELLITKQTIDTLIECGLPKIYISFHPAWLNLDEVIHRFLQFFHPFYHITNGDKIYSASEFSKALHEHDHSFLLIKK